MTKTTMGALLLYFGLSTSLPYEIVFHNPPSHRFLVEKQSSAAHHYASNALPDAGVLHRETCRTWRYRSSHWKAHLSRESLIIWNLVILAVW